ncbi:MAG: N-formylglutamate amidohydrolase, partial [Planctomycetaceae bacterium]|nr:N-formylglutamate amidohydrolase [Planctomycetaceae bacterium]
MSIRVHGIRAVVLLLCFSIVTDCSFAGEEAGGLVTVESGDLPIILTAPHGGSEAVPGVSPRIGEGVDLFQSKSDSFTDELAEKLADAIEARLGKRPYIVIARFHRKYIDANRPPELAYESGQAKLVYDEYHRAIAAARREVINRWGAGILLDLHGQKAEPQTIFRGTQNGKTARSLENRFGRVALTGEQSLFGRLAQQGFHVQPAVNSDEPEDARYNGGYTVGTYGSASGGAFDAVQLELGFSLRTRDV